MTKGPRFYSPYDATMWESIGKKDMQLQQCKCCSSFRYPPGPACPDCLSVDSNWVSVSGKGRVLSWTVFHRQYLPAYPAPSVVLAVKLDEGPIMVSNIDVNQAPDLKLGATVDMIYGEHPDGYTLPRFALARSL